MHHFNPPAMSPDLETKLRAYEALVRRWSAKINLVSRADLENLWPRHIEDSLALISHIPEKTTHAIDLGSGAGFPGLVLAIATNIPFTLIEADKRKAAFLTDAAREFSAPVKVLAQRIEDARPEPAPLITARALAPLEKLLGLAWPHLVPNGICLFPKGENAEAEIAAAEPHWHMDIERCKTRHGQILKLGQIRYEK
jgi:16S rRNA (guanine527-N7)-methyltransferase